MTESPLNTAIDLAAPVKVEKRIKIVIPENYELNFVFERAGVSFEQLRTSIGSMGACRAGDPCPKGVPVPVRWSVHNVETGTAISSGEVETLDSNGWSVANVYRRIGYVKIPKGEYVFRAEVLRPIPELAYLRTRIALQLEPKGGSTWQIGLVWWGSIATYLLAWPAVIYATILLLWRAGLALRSRNTPASGHPSPKT